MNNMVVQQDTLISFMWFSKEGVLVEVEAAQAAPSSGQIPLQSLLIQIVGATPVGIAPYERTIPTTPELFQNYPNPFNPSTIIRYSLPENSQVRLIVLNTFGQQVGAIVDAEQAAGNYQVEWKTNLTTGMYFYRIEVVALKGEKRVFTSTRKMVMVK